MNTSTPTSMGPYRQSKLIPDETSPILIVSPDKGSEVPSFDNLAQKSPTELSGDLDRNCITPVKVLTESKEDKKLAGGARDLSLAGKRSSSLPNLSWDNVENSLFRDYPTRNRMHLVRNRMLSMGDIDDIDYTRWSNKDFPDGDAMKQGKELEKQDTESEKLCTDSEVKGGNGQVGGCVTSNGSPMLRNSKRQLNVSPSTPIGLLRKHLFREQRQEMMEITFSEDIDMVDLEEKGDINYSNEGVSTNKIKAPTYGELSNRKIIRGKRRDSTCVPVVDNRCDGLGITPSFWDLNSSTLRTNKLDVSSDVSILTPAGAATAASTTREPAPATSLVSSDASIVAPADAATAASTGRSASDLTLTRAKQEVNALMNDGSESTLVMENSKKLELKGTSVNFIRRRTKYVDKINTKLKKKDV